MSEIRGLFEEIIFAEFRQERYVGKMYVGIEDGSLKIEEAVAVAFFFLSPYATIDIFCQNF